MVSTKASQQGRLSSLHETPSDVKGKAIQFLSLAEQLTVGLTSNEFNGEVINSHEEITNDIKLMLNAPRPPTMPQKSDQELCQIHRKYIHSLNELILLKRPQIIKPTDYVQVSVTLDHNKTQLLAREPFSIQMLVVGSKLLYNAIIDGDNVRIDCCRTFYKLSYKLSMSHQRNNHRLLPGMDKIYYLEQNKEIPSRCEQLKYIKYLQTEFGFIPFHHKFIKSRWCQWNGNKSINDYGLQIGRFHMHNMINKLGTFTML